MVDNHWLSRWVVENQIRKLVTFRDPNLFPNLVLNRMAHFFGDILKTNLKQQRQLRVVSLPNLFPADLVDLVANCKKIEFIELIYPQMVEYLKLLPRLKFIFLTLKQEQHKMARSMAYLLYYNLGTTDKDPFYYSNQLYCPRDHRPNQNLPSPSISDFFFEQMDILAKFKQHSRLITSDLLQVVCWPRD